MSAPDDPRRAALDAAAPPRALRRPSAGEGEPDPASLRARLAARPAAPAVPSQGAPDPGRILARLSRTDGTELRVSLHRYQGRPFVRVGPWQSSAADAWPVKGKGATVKVRELAAVAAGLLDALEAAENDDG